MYFCTKFWPLHFFLYNRVIWARLPNPACRILIKWAHSPWNASFARRSRHFITMYLERNHRERIGTPWNYLLTTWHVRPTDSWSERSNEVLEHGVNLRGLLWVSSPSLEWMVYALMSLGFLQPRWLQFSASQSTPSVGIELKLSLLNHIRALIDRASAWPKALQCTKC